MKRCEKTFWTNVLINGLTSPEKKQKQHKTNKTKQKRRHDFIDYRMP